MTGEATLSHPYVVRVHWTTGTSTILGTAGPGVGLPDIESLYARIGITRLGIWPSGRQCWAITLHRKGEDDPCQFVTAATYAYAEAWTVAQNCLADRAEGAVK